jgi:hypothetical protein
MFITQNRVEIRLRNEGVFVMADLRLALIAYNSSDNIKTQGFVFYLVLLDEVLCRIPDPPSFMIPDGLLCFANSLIPPGLDLDKNQPGRGTGSVNKNKIDLPVLTAEIARNEPVTLFF